MPRCFLSVLTTVSSLPFFLLQGLGADFAGGVVSYDPGSGAAPRYHHPEVALGQPSSTNPFGEPTDPFNPPYGTNQVVSIGSSGHLTVRFDRPLLNHPHHPFGLDFTIFGNAGFIITNEFDLTTYEWVGTPATDGSLFGADEGGVLVSVSRDGQTYFPLDPNVALRPDGFAPTDPTGDFGVPIPTGLSAADCAGATLDDLRLLYAGSAGGASYDLSWALDATGRRVFLPEVRYVRIDVLGGRVEVDAIASVDRASRGRGARP